MDKVRVFLFLLLAFVLLAGAPGRAMASCVTPAGEAGYLEYFSASEQIFKYCDGTSWVDWGDGGAGGLWMQGAANNIYYTSGATPQVGIGLTLPTSMLDVAGTVTANSLLLNAVAGNAPVSNIISVFTGLTDTPPNYTGAANQFVKVNGAGDALVFSAGSASSIWTASGDDIYYNSGTPRVAIGTNLPIHSFTISGNNADIGHYSYSDTFNFKPDWYGYRARGTEAAPTTVLDNNELAGIGTYAYDGNSWERTGQILFEVNGTVADETVPTDIVFLVSPTNGAGNTERMRILSTGEVGIGTATPNLTGVDRALTVSSGAAESVAALEIQGNVTTDTTMAALGFYNGANIVGGIEAVRVGANNTAGMKFTTYSAGAASPFMLLTHSGRLALGGLATPQTLLDIDGAFSMRAMAAPALSPVDEGRIYYNSTSNKFQVSENGGAYVNLVGGAGGGAINDLSDAATNYPNNNMYIGTGVGNGNTTGKRNFGIGVNALKNMSNACTPDSSPWTCADNTAVGANSALSLTTGTGNTFLGQDSGRFTTTAFQNTFVGESAGEDNVSGDENAYFGYMAGFSVLGDRTTAIGSRALQFSSATGITGNTAVGYWALRGDGTVGLKTGTDNTALGREAGTEVTSGSNNILIGSGAGTAGNVAGALETGSGNILIGMDVLTSSSTASNELNIGNIIYASGLNTATTHVGIGTTNAQGRELYLDGNATILATQGSSWGEGLRIVTDANDKAAMLHFGRDATGTDVEWSMGLAFYADNAREDDLVFQAKDMLGSAITAEYRYDTAMVIEAPSGNAYFGADVGIGTTAPMGNLQIKQETDSADDATLANYGLIIGNPQNDTGEEVGIGFRLSLTLDNTKVPGAAITHERTGSNSIGSLHFKTSPANAVLTTRMSIDKDGLISFTSSGAFLMNNGTTAQRPATGANGMMRFNTTTDAYEVYSTTAANWVEIVSAGVHAGAGGGAINDLSDAATNYTSNNVFLGQGTGAVTTGASNVGLGKNVLDVNVAGFRNTGMGHNVLGANLGGNSNAGFGYNVLLNNTAGNFNTAIGREALRENTLAHNSVAVGYQALLHFNPVSGDAYNVAVGADALMGTTGVSTGVRNTAIGALAGANVESGSDNVFIGHNAGNAMTTGSGAVLIGRDAGLVNTASSNVFIGMNAGDANIGGSVNTFVGRSAGSANVGNTENSYFGGSAGNKETGSGNSMFGARAGKESVGGDNNSFFGRVAGLNSGAGDESVYLGRSAGENSTGHRNIAVGAWAYSIAGATGADNIIIGKSINPPTAATSKWLNIGDTIFGDLTQTGVIYISNSGAFNVSVGTTLEEPAPLNGMLRYDTGTGKLRAVEGGAWTNVIGGSGSSIWTASGDDIYYNSGTPQVGIGLMAPTTALEVVGTVKMDALQFNTVGGASAPVSSIVTTFSALTDTPANYTGAANKFVKVNGTPDALEFVTIPLNDLSNVSVAVPSTNDVLTYNGTNWVSQVPAGGGGAINDLSDAATNYTSNNMFLGEDSGGVKAGATATGVWNTVLGSDAGTLLSTGDRNTLIGAFAGEAVTSGIENTLIGAYVGRNITTTSSNVMIGYKAGNLSTAAQNVYIGIGAGEKNVDGAQNVMIGYIAGKEATTGGDNTFVGYLAGLGDVAVTTGAQNTFIGNFAGRWNTSGLSNTFLGSDAGNTNRAGRWNTIIGESAGTTLNGDGLGAGDSNILIGRAVDVPLATTSNYLSIGDTIYGTGVGTAAPKVGIGTAAPGQTLDVEGAAASTNYIFKVQNTTASGELILGTNHNDNPVFAVLTDATGNGYLRMRDNAQTDANTFFWDSAQGRLGIGDITPDHTLDVNGNIGLTSSSYINWGNTSGTTGYGIRDNAGTIECKNSAGSWAACAGGGGGAINDLSDGKTSYVSASMFLGADAGLVNTAIDNTFVGYHTGDANTSGSKNTFVGRSSGGSNVSGGNNTYLGSNSGRDATGGTNTFLGALSGKLSTAGTNNVFVGYKAGESNAGGDLNTYIGSVAGSGATGNRNIAIGYQTYDIALATGSDNLLIGYNIDTPAVGTSNHLNIGDLLIGDMSTGILYVSGSGARFGIGATPATGIELDVQGDIEYTGTITDVSDRRLKKDIMKLDTEEIMGKLTQIDTYSFRMIDDPDNKLELGVIAQELEELFPELVRTADDEMGTKSVNYVGLIAPLIETSKALKTENDNLKLRLASMEETQDKILREVSGLKAYTGYGINKASMGGLALMMIATAFGTALTVFAFGGFVRRRRKP